MASKVSLSDIAQQLKELQRSVSISQSQQSANGDIAPTVPVMFSTKSIQDWISPPFYTHHRGYKMRLVVLYNYVYAGCKFTTISPAGAVDSKRGPKTYGTCAYFVLDEGEFDDYLRFPIRLSLELHVMKKDTDQRRSFTYTFDDTTPSKYTERQLDSCSSGALDEDLKRMLLFTADEVKSYSIDDTFTFKVVVTNT